MKTIAFVLFSLPLSKRACATPALGVSPQRAQEIENLWEEHLKYEFDPESKSTAKTMDTMVEDHPYVNHVPTLIGGCGGKKSLADFYENHFIFKNPAMHITPVSRIIGYSQLVDEMVISFKHDSHVDWLAPGVEPTGKQVTFPLVAIVKFKDTDEGRLKVAHEHIYWDQATILKQMGVLDGTGLDVSGAEQAAKVQDCTSVPSNEFLRRTGRYVPQSKKVDYRSSNHPMSVH